MISSRTLKSKLSGTIPAPIPWIKCGPRNNEPYYLSDQERDLNSKELHQLMMLYLGIIYIRLKIKTNSLPGWPPLSTALSVGSTP